MKGEVSAKQRRFAEEYLVDCNATQAAIRAGYSAKSAEVQGCKLLRNPKVSEFLKKAQAERSKRLEVKADDVLRELLRIGRLDVGQLYDENDQLLPLKKMPEEARRAIVGIEFEDIWGHADDGEGNSGRIVTGKTSKVKLANKVAALDLLGKHLKLFGNDTAPPGNVTVLIGSFGKDKPDAK